MTTPPSGAAKAEFDEDKCWKEFPASRDSMWRDYRAGAEWQFNQDAAAIEQLQRELEEAKADRDATEKVYRMNREYVENAKAALSAKDAEIEKLKSVVQFYADREHWNISDPNGSAHVIHSSDVDTETNFGGSRARQALGEKEEG